MKIADSGLMPRTPAQPIAKMTVQVAGGSATDSFETGDFPTLLSIPWQTPEAGEAGDGPKGNADGYVEPDIKAHTVPADHGLLKAIANGLLMNPNLSISITTANEEVNDSLAELERLKAQFEEVASKEAASAFQFGPAAPPNQEPAIKPGATELPRPVPQPFGSGGVLTAGGTPLPQTLKGMEQQMIGNPAAPVSAFEKPAMTDATNRASNAVLPDHLNKVTVTKSETHHSFIQPSLPSQLPDLISSAAKSVPTHLTPSVSNLATGVESLPKTTSMIEVQLVPKNLGTVQVTIQRHEGAVSLVILTETAAAEKLLTNESNAIRESLKSAGLIPDEIRVQAVAQLDREHELKFDRSLTGENSAEHRESSRADRDESTVSGEEAQRRAADAERLDVLLPDNPAPHSGKETGWYI